MVDIPQWLRPLLVNWQDVAIYCLRGVQTDGLADGTQEMADLLRRLVVYPDVPASSKGQTSLRLFTTIATLGTTQDVTVQELCIECFFSADADTTKVLKDWSADTLR